MRVEEEFIEDDFDERETDDEIVLVRVLKKREFDGEEEFLVEWSNGEQQWMPYDELEQEDLGIQLITKFSNEKKKYQETKKKENIEKLKGNANPSRPTQKSQRFSKTKSKTPLNTSSYSVTITNNFQRRISQAESLESLTARMKKAHAPSLDDSWAKSVVESLKKEKGKFAFDNF